jgi:hypothetical protein
MEDLCALTFARIITLSFLLCLVMQSLSLLAPMNNLSTLCWNVLFVSEGKVVMGQATFRCLQMFFQYKYFIPDPIENDVKYQARAQPFLVFGLLTTGLAIGQSNAL